MPAQKECGPADHGDRDREHADQSGEGVVLEARPRVEALQRVQIEPVATAPSVMIEEGQCEEDGHEAGPVDDQNQSSLVAVMEPARPGPAP